MKKQKQKAVLDILATGRYKVVGDEVLSFRCGEWRRLSPNKLPSGYEQLQIFNGKRGLDGFKVIVYKHILIYLAAKGEYPEGWQIDHVDRDNQNNYPDNLVAKDPLGNVMNSRRDRHPNRIEGTVRGPEIASIRELHSAGHSQAAIARSLGLNRLTVRYAVKKIERGEPFKYENWVASKSDSI